MGDTLAKPITDKYSTILENDMLTVGATGMQGWRRGMEDAHATVLKLDGAEAGPSLSEEYKRGDWKGAMKKAFLNLDAELRKSPQADSSGCTAVCCLITPCGRLVVGNAGDSRCIMSRGGKPWALSFDHKPTNEEERARITAAGGFVTSGRVQGNLALSRAIGDYEFKNNTSLSAEEQMVTANPEITVTEIREGDEYIVLACDGIWDCMTNEEVIDFVSKGINDNDVARVCEDTCDRCLAPQTPGVGCDNMTMMIVKLKDVLTKSAEKKHFSQTASTTE